MTLFFRSITVPALIGLALIAPLMVLELVNRRQFEEDFPAQLFIIMWVMGAVGALGVMQAARSVRLAAWRGLLRPRFWLGALLASAAAYLFGKLLIDQWSCFLGVPLCD